MRLDKYVADALGLTRSEARELIKRGGLTVDGQPAAAPAAHVDCQEVLYKGEKLKPKGLVYLMMNKPAGVLSVTEDKNQKTVMDLLPVGKTYLVRLSRDLDDEKIYILENGVDIVGYVTKPCKVERLEPRLAKITITEGKYHQVKRMFLAVGNHVDSLKRISFAGLELDESLAPGEYRELCTKELDKILRTIQ